MQDFWAQLLKFGRGAAASLWRFVRRFALPFLASAVLVLAAIVLWSQYRDWATQRLVLLVGPGGGSGMRDARAIAEHIEDESTWYGRRYRVRLESTEGYEENRKRIGADGAGTVFGFAHDGFGEQEEHDRVRILLPLDLTYLHILHRTGADDAAPPTSLASSTAATAPAVTSLNGDSVPTARPSPTLSAVLGQLKSGRVYLGPADSGTRQLAEYVLRYYGRNPDDFPTSGIRDWHEMRAALGTSAIDLAFYAGPQDAQIVQRIAKDGKTRLLGLNGVRDAICQGCSHIVSAKFASNSYSEAFCSESLETIASRRVLLCSPAMSEADGYVISKASFDALRSRYPAIGLDNIRNSGNYSENLRYELHNGARLLSDNARPSVIPEWIRGLNYVFVTVAVVLLTPILRRLNAMLRHRKSDQPVGEPESSEGSWYVRLNGQCEALLAQIEHSPRDIAAETLNSWAQRSEALRQQLVQLEQEKKIEPKEASSLRAGLRHIAIELGEHRRTKERPRRV